MSVAIYKVGYRHGYNGIKRMSHRKNQRPYDSKRAQESYNIGYEQGIKDKHKS